MPSGRESEEKVKKGKLKCEHRSLLEQGDGAEVGARDGEKATAKTRATEKHMK